MVFEQIEHAAPRLGKDASAVDEEQIVILLEDAKNSAETIKAEVSSDEEDNEDVEPEDGWISDLAVTRGARQVCRTSGTKRVTTFSATWELCDGPTRMERGVVALRDRTGHPGLGPLSDGQFWPSGPDSRSKAPTRAT